MCADLNALLETIAHGRVTLMGHSLGGQVVMQSLFRGLCSEAIRQTIIVDVAPRPIKFTGSQSLTLLERMLELEKANISSRSAAQEFMSEIEPDSSVVQFLVSNGAVKEGSFNFNIPLVDLRKGMFTLQETYGDPVSKPACNIQALFIKGGKSDFIRNPEEHNLIRSLFPNSKIKLMKDAGHWPHYDSPDEFCRIVSEFLQSDSNIS
jgi:pimeloyl-ACP methyl ester carboxylesterase